MSLKDTAEGVYAPADGGGYLDESDYGVHHRPGSVGRGPVGDTDRAHAVRLTANGRLRNRVTEIDQNLWIVDFTSSFTITGTEAQSRTQKEFFPRHFSQPRYHIVAQTFNEEQYLLTAQFIRRAMMNQLHAPLRELRKRNMRKDLLVLTIDDTVLGRSGSIPRVRNGRRVDHRHKGGYKGWQMAGYIESIETGAERFVNAPDIEFDFVVVNAEEGITAQLDRLARGRDVERFMGQFNRRTPDPDVALPTAFDERKKKPKKAPPGSTKDDPLPNNPLNEIIEVGDQVWDWLGG